MIYNIKGKESSGSDHLFLIGVIHWSRFELSYGLNELQGATGQIFHAGGILKKDEKKRKKEKEKFAQREALCHIAYCMMKD